MTGRRLRCKRGARSLPCPATMAWMDDAAIRQTLASGDPVPVWIGEAPRFPTGDLGHPRTDGRLLLAVLAADKKAAQFLKSFGVDEAAVRAFLGAYERPEH